MKHKVVVILGSVGVAGVVLGALTVLRFMPYGGDSGEWPDYFSADQLINDSDRVVIARYLDETPYVVPVISAADGLPHGSVTEVVRRFEVIESLKGEVEVGETTYVVVTAGYTEELDDGRSRFHAYDVIHLSPGQEYVLFLEAVPRRPEYPTRYGEVVWVRPGEPSIAVMEPNGNLRFMTTDRFNKENRDRLADDSTAPFVLTREQILSLVSQVVNAAPVLEATSTVSPDTSPASDQPSARDAGFGGLFLDADDDSVLYVYLLDPSQAEAEAAALKYFGRSRMDNIREVRPVKARFTMRQLEEYYQALTNARPLSLPEVTMTDLDESKNRIEVGINCESSRDRVRLELQKRLNSLKVPIDAFVFEVRCRAFPLSEPPRFECIPSETIDPITGLSIPGFGGLSVESGIAKVYLLEPSQETATELVLEQFGRKSFQSLQGIRALKGLYTWTQLTEWYGAIRDDLGQFPAVGIVAPDPSRNRVSIEVRSQYDPNTERRIQEVLSRHGVPYEAVTVDDSTPKK